MKKSEKTFYINSFLNFDINDSFVIVKRKLIPFIKTDRSLFFLKKDNRFRLICKRLIESKFFQAVIMLSIFANCLVLSLHQNYPNNDSNSRNELLENSELTFLIIFVVECILKIIVLGFILHPKSYLRDFWNILDFSIVLLGFLTLILSYLQQGKVDVKALRAFRVLRPLRLVSRLPSLQIVLNSILIAMKPLANVGILVILLIIGFSVAALTLFVGIFHSTCYNNVTKVMMPNPVPCNSRSFDIGYKCTNISILPEGEQWTCYSPKSLDSSQRFQGPNYGITNFDHMGFAMLTVFQIITCQGWSDIMYWTMNVYGNAWPWIYFLLLLIFGPYYILNLINGVLCGEFAKEKSKVDKRIKFISEKQNTKEMQDFLNYKLWIEHGEKIEQIVYEENSGKKNTGFQIPSFHNDDNENENKTKFTQFLDQLKLLKKKCISFVEKFRLFYFTVIKSRIYFIVILLLVFINSAIMATEFSDQPVEMYDFQNYSNFIFVVIFTIEMLLKLFTLGIKDYFAKLFNIYDFIIITISIVELALDFSNIFPQIGISVLRSVRLLRIFKLTKYWDKLRSLANNIISSIKCILSLLLLLGIFIIISSLLGMQLFGGKYIFNRNTILRSNFDDMIQAVITVFQLITIEQWNEEMYNGIQALGGLNGAGSFASVYFVIVIIIGNYILLNVFFAIILQILTNEKENNENNKDDQKLESSDIESSEDELDVPVIDQLVVMNGLPMMPPNIESNIVSINPVKTKFRRHAALEHRVRVSIKKQEKKPILITEKKSKKLTYEELYRGEEEDAINMELFGITTNNTKKQPKTFDTAKNQIPLPPGVSCFLFKDNNKFRIYCHKIVNYSLVKNILLVFIICSCLMLVFFDPLNSRSNKFKVLKNFDLAFTVVFVLELCLNIISYGLILHKGAYLRNIFNWIDFTVVATGIIDPFFNDVSIMTLEQSQIQLLIRYCFKRKLSTRAAVKEICDTEGEGTVSQSKVCRWFLGIVESKFNDFSGLKTLRILRILKTVRTIERAKELKNIINSLIIAVKKVWRIMLVILLLQFMFSIIGINLFGGKLYYCTDVSRMTKEDCMGTFISYSLDGSYVMRMKNRTWHNFELNFDNLPRAMLTLFVITTFSGYPELLYRSIDATKPHSGPYFNNNRAMFFFYLFYFIVVKFFMLNIFIGYVILSYQKSKESQNKSDEMDKNQKQCISFVLQAKPIRRYIPTGRIRYRIWKIVDSKIFENFIFIVIILNTISMTIVNDLSSSIQNTIVLCLNYVFVLLFTFDAILKMIAFKFRNYFDDPMNVFDCIVIIGSVVDMVFFQLNIAPETASINIFRLLRVFRLVKLLLKFKSFQKLLWTFIQSFKVMPWLIFFVFMIFFAYAVIGAEFFAKIGLYNPGSSITINNNFQNVFNSFLILLRCVTGGKWHEIMISCYDPELSKCYDSDSSCGSFFAYFYFPSFIIISSYLVMQIFLGIIIDNFDFLIKDRSLLNPHDLMEFIDLWSQYDFDGRGRIKPLDAVNLLLKINPPLGFGRMCPHDRCMKKLMLMNMPLEEDGTILFRTMLFYLIRGNLKIKLPSGAKDHKTMNEYNEELRILIKRLWPKTSSTLLAQIIPRSIKNTVTVEKYYSTLIIQNNFRKWKLVKKNENPAKVEKPLVKFQAFEKIREIVEFISFPFNRDLNVNSIRQKFSHIFHMDQKFYLQTDEENSVEKEKSSIIISDKESVSNADVLDNKENSTLEGATEAYRKISNSFWNYYKKFFILQDDNSK